MKRGVITGSGAFIPSEIVTNAGFTQHPFYGEDRKPITLAPDIVVEKFRQITGISERRYATPQLNASDIAAAAAKLAIEDSGVDPETLDQIILAHNFGDVRSSTIQCDAVPALASRVKHILGIRNPHCVAYDILFGCPGWVQGVIQSEAYFRSGMATRTLVIGAETLSRVIDPFDRDSMIFSDGAGATVHEWKETGDNGPGLLGYGAVSHCIDEAYYINMGPSYLPDSDPGVRYIKMKGRKVYEYALANVPLAMKECLDRSGVPVEAVKKVFIHQANEKMDEAIIKAFFKLYGAKPPEGIMPMSIHWLGNSSVATVPTLWDLVVKGKEKDHTLSSGDVVLFASVGAGMNINAVSYRY